MASSILAKSLLVLLMVGGACSQNSHSFLAMLTLPALTALVRAFGHTVQHSSIKVLLLLFASALIIEPEKVKASPDSESVSEPVSVSIEDHGLTIIDDQLRVIDPTLTPELEIQVAWDENITDMDEVIVELMLDSGECVEYFNLTSPGENSANFTLNVTEVAPNKYTVKVTSVKEETYSTVVSQPIFIQFYLHPINSSIFEMDPVSRYVTPGVAVSFMVSFHSNFYASCVCTWTVAGKTRVPFTGMRLPQDFPARTRFVFKNIGTFEVKFHCLSADPGSMAEVSSNIIVQDWNMEDFTLNVPKYQLMNGYVPSSSFLLDLEFGVFEDPPLDLTASITYGDESPPDVFEVTSLALHRHVYPSRATYAGIVVLEHPEKGNTKLTFHARVGFCQVTVNPLYGLMETVDYTFSLNFPELMDATIEFNWLDGTADSTETFFESQSYQYTHNYINSGEFYPTFTFRGISNSSIVEIEGRFSASPIRVEAKLDDTLRLTIKDSPVIVPTGEVEAMVTLARSENPVLDMECWINFEEDLDPAPRHWQGGLDTRRSFRVPFKFYTLGAHDVQANCSNVYSQVTLNFYVFVYNPCFSNDSVFNEQYRFYNPLITQTSQELRLVSRNIIYCPNPSFWWILEEVTSEGSLKRAVNLAEQPLVDFLTLEPGCLAPGLYVMKLNITFGNEYGNSWLLGGVYVKVVQSPIVAGIEGGSFRTTDDPRSTVDGYSLSYDPVFGVDNKTGLQFVWTCFTFNSTSLDELMDSASHPLPANLTSDCDDISTETTPGYRQLQVGTDVAAAGYMFKLTAKKGTASSKPAKVYIQYSRTTIDIELVCLANCESKTAVTSHVLLSVLCEACSDTDLMQASYVWSLFLHDNSTGLFNPVAAGGDYFTPSGVYAGPMASIRENSLMPCDKYRVSLKMTTLAGFVAVAGREMLTNCPPWGGNCTVTPTSGDAVNTTFEVFCTGWQDDGLTKSDDDEDDDDDRDSTDDSEESLFTKMFFYRFLLRKNGITVPIAETAQSAMPRSEMPLIPGQVGGYYDLIVRIYDVLEDYTEVLLPIHLDVSHLGEEASVNGSKVAFWKNQTKYSDEKSTLDKHMRMIVTASGLLNSVPIPDVRNPLEVAIENKSKVAVLDEDWKKLWQNLNVPSVNPTKNALIEITKSFSKQVQLRGNDCSQLTGQGVAALGEGMASALNNPDTVDEESAILASEAAEKGSQSLINLYNKKPFPVSARLDEAVSSMAAMIDRVLAATVPTYDLSIGSDLLFNSSDVGPDDSLFMVSRMKKIHAERERHKMEAGRQAVPNLNRAVGAMLNTLLRGMVLGQGPRHMRRGHVGLSARKMTGRSLANAKLDTTGAMDLQLDLADQEDGGTTDPDAALDIKTSVYDKNPYSWSSDGSSYEITSPVVTVEAKDSHGRNKTLRKVTIAIKRDDTDNNPAPVIHPFSSSDTRDGPDGWLYHRLTLRSGSSAVVTRFRLPENFTTVTAYFRTGRPPTSAWNDYKTIGVVVSSNRRRRRSADNNASSGELRQFYVPPGSLSPGIVFVGFHLPELDANASVQYGFSSFTDMCRVWNADTETWDGTSCTVSAFSSPEETVCICDNPPGTSFASSFFVAPNTIDWDTVFLKFDPSNAAVYGTLIGLFCLWLLAVLWARPRDRRDRQSWMVGYLSDNYVRDSHFYMLTVYTGMRKGAGTKSNIRFVVAGENGQSRVRLLSDGEREVSRGSVLTFIMTSPQDLGHLRCVRLWHDDSAVGDLSSWYLSRIVIENLHTGDIYNFICERWFAVDKDDGQIDRLVPAIRRDEDVGFVRLFQERTRMELTESHIWLSCFMRPERSSFTRVQRVTCCFALLLLTMISSAMFYQPEDEETGESHNNVGMEVTVGPLRFSMTSLWTSAVSVALSTIPVLLFVVLFRSYRPRSGPRVTVRGLHASDNTSIWHRRKNDAAAKKNTLDSELNKSPKQTGMQNVESKSSKVAWNPSNDSFSDCSEAKSKKQREDMARNLCDVLEGVLQQNPLPHWSAYVTWLMLLLTIAACAFFLLLYSMQWGPTTSQEWLGSFFLSFIQSIFFMDPVKVLLLACLLAYCAPNPLTNTQHQHVDINRVEREVQSLAVDYVDPTAEPPEAISEKVLRASRKRHQQERLAQQVFVELILYFVFVFCIFSISYGSRDTKTYWTNAHVDNMLYSTKGHAPFPFESITSRPDVIRYMNETLLASAFPWTDMIGQELSWRQRQFASDGVSFRLGPMRVRQVRLPAVSSLDVIRMYPTLRSSEEIHQEYSTEREDRSSYCLGWNPLPCPEEEATTKYSTAAWSYTEDATPISIWGIYHFYGSGGYAADLSVNRDVVVRMIEELHQEKWLDLHTRAVFVEACLYNPNTNLFTFLRLGVEFPKTGASVTWRELQTLRLYQHLGAMGHYLFICELLAVIFVLVFSVRIVLKLKEQRCSFFKDIWQILDFVALFWTCIAVVFYATKAISVDEQMSTWRHNPKVYVDFYATVIWDAVYGYILAVLVFAVTVRLLRVLGYNRRVTMLATVLKRSYRDLLGYSFMFFIVISAFASAGHLLFGTELIQFRSAVYTYEWLYIVLLGRNKLGLWIRNAPLWAQFYYISLTILVLFILYTMFEAILCNSTTVVKSQVDSVPPPYGLTNVLAQYYRAFVDLLPAGLLHGNASGTQGPDSKGKPPTDHAISMTEASAKVNESINAKKMKKAMMAAAWRAPKKLATFHRPDDKPYLFELEGPPSAVKIGAASNACDGDRTPPTTVSAFINDELMKEMARMKGVMQDLLEREEAERRNQERQKQSSGIVMFRV